MANRDVALGLSGVVVGVLLGAGSVLTTQDAALSASSVDQYAAVYFDADQLGVDPSEISARNVERQNQADVAKDNATADRKAKAASLREKANVHESAPSLPPNPCDVAKNLSQRMGLAIETVIPAEQQYEKFVDPLGVVLQNIEKDYCGSTATDVQTGEEVMKHAAPKRVDNDCEQYEKGSPREAKCLGNELKGQNYIGN